MSTTKDDDNDKNKPKGHHPPGKDKPRKPDDIPGFPIATDPPPPKDG
jgi:hypothetical protein